MSRKISDQVPWKDGVALLIADSTYAYPELSKPMPPADDAADLSRALTITGAPSAEQKRIISVFPVQPHTDMSSWTTDDLH